MLRIIIITLVFSLSQLYAQAFYENAPEFNYLWKKYALEKKIEKESLLYKPQNLSVFIPSVKSRRTWFSAKISELICLPTSATTTPIKTPASPRKTAFI